MRAAAHLGVRADRGVCRATVETRPALQGTRLSTTTRVARQKGSEHEPDRLAGRGGLRRCASPDRSRVGSPGRGGARGRRRHARAVPEGSRLKGVAVIELRLPPPAVVTLIVRDGTTPVPDPDTDLRAGDELLLITTPVSREAAERRLRAIGRRGQTRPPARRTRKPRTRRRLRQQQLGTPRSAHRAGRGPAWSGRTAVRAAASRVPPGCGNTGHRTAPPASALPPTADVQLTPSSPHLANRGPHTALPLLSPPRSRRRRHRPVTSHRPSPWGGRIRGV